MKYRLSFYTFIMILASCNTNQNNSKKSHHSLEESLVQALKTDTAIVQPPKNETSLGNQLPKKEETQESKSVPAQAKQNDLMTVTGKRNIQDITDEIADHLISVNFWYARSFPKESQKQRITVKFQINEQGIPSNIQLISTDMKDGEFVEKVVRDIKEWRFAWFKHGSDTTTVIYPIIFQPTKSH